MRKDRSFSMDAIPLAIESQVNNHVNVHEILHRAGLSSSLQDTQNQRLPSEEVGNIILTLVDALKDETLGFLERPTSPGGIELLCLVVVSQKTLRAAFEKCSLFVSLVHDDIQFDLSEGKVNATLSVRYVKNREQDNAVFTTMLFIVLLRLARWLTDKALILDQLNLTTPAPSFAKDYKDVFPCPHYFDQSENYITFSRRFLDNPVIQTPDSIPNFLRMLPNLLTSTAIDESVSGRVKRLLRSKDVYAPMSLSTVADRLQMSEAKLSRQLKKEGNTFAQIKDSVRRDVALMHLRRGDKSISEISYLLGFSQPSAFNRAFRSWTGDAPGAYRVTYKIK
ncbi:MAG: AraC family transcriptional regulator [Pseudomonadota bacterium]